jgi:glutaminyl-tRNA synthetase
MASPNINMRDPAIYRIRRATHHNTGDKWCIYPMYTYAHPIEDALEQITHSICTLEFEDQRPFYDWLMARLIEGGLLASPPPHQYEFARLNLTYVITSKRKLAQLVYDHKVNGWDDPRMPTIVGLRRRGYTPAALQLFAERIGVTKSDSWIDYATLEGCLREDLELKAHRGMAVLNPVKLVLTNWDEVMGAGHLEPCSQPALPHAPEGTEPPPARQFSIGKEVWIDREDFEEVPPKGYKRLFPGNKVRLKGGYVIECTGCNKDADG